MNNYRFLEMRVDKLGRKKMTQDELAKKLNIDRNRIQQLETSPKVIPKEEELRAYCEHFNTTSDYLLGIRDTRPVDENLAMISKVTGLSDRSIQVLKKWNKLKKTPINGINGYGGTDIDALNLLLEDYYLSMETAGQKGLADWSIFHHIYNYIFSEHLKKHPYNIVKYTHAPDVSDEIRSELKKGDVIISNGVERTIDEIEIYNERGFESASDNLSIYNDTNQKETYRINFQKVMDSYTKNNILLILERIKKHVKGGK